jgi:hypothetical protein
MASDEPSTRSGRGTPVGRSGSGRNERKVPRRGTAHFRNWNGAIESRQASAALHRQSEQVDVGQLAMARGCSRCKEIGVSEGDVIGPETMPAAAAEGPEVLEQGHHLGRGLRVGRIPQHAEEPVLGQWARGPAASAVFCEPVVSRLVVNVIRIEKRHQDVDVEERDSTHGSSRRRFTRAIVGLGLPAGRRGKSGTPLRTSGGATGSNAFRASSDSTCPAVVLRFAAISLTA